MSQQTEQTVVRCRQCGTVLENPKPGQKAVICPGCGAAYVVHDSHAGWLQRNWELIQYRIHRRKKAQEADIHKTSADREPAEKPVTGQVNEPAEMSAAGTEERAIIHPVPVKKPGKGKWKIILPIAVGIFIVLGLTMPYVKSAVRTHQWEKLHLTRVLPAANFPIEKTIYNEEEQLSVYFLPVEKEQYIDFIRQCEEMGFHWKPRFGESRMKMYSDEGWVLDLTYTITDQRLHLSLESTAQLGPMLWPYKSLPKPPASASYTARSRGENFHVYVGPMDHSQWSQYVDQAMAEGYIYDVFRRRDGFTACRKDGASLRINYEGNQVVEIWHDEP